MIKNPPANAGDTGSSPGLGRSHMSQMEQLSQCATTTEPVLFAREPQLLSPCATTTEAHASIARALQQEKPPQWEARAPQQRVAPACHN